MKLIKTIGADFIRYHKEYAPGEKYISLRRWFPSDGPATKENVENIIPNCRFDGIQYYRGLSLDTLTYKSTMDVRVELTA